MTIERGKRDRESFIDLVQATNPLPTNPLESFTYDEVGNRVNSNQNGASTFNQANQLLEDASFTYQYDANGNLTRKTAKVGGALTSYEYDAENKLARVVSNGTVADYRYDGLGRRVEKQVTQGPTTNVTRYIYDNEDILLELDGSNNITARYTHGPGIDEPLIMEKGGASFFYHADTLGSITEISNQSGTVVQSYTYSSFGKIESQLDPTFIQPYTFTSREFDPETGLYYYRARYYDAATGRFLSADPLASKTYPFPEDTSVNPFLAQMTVALPEPEDIGIQNTPTLTSTLMTSRTFAGQNAYGYVGNNPTTLTDPSGENAALIRALQIAAAAAARYAKEAVKFCRNVRCKIGVHPADHYFGFPFYEKKRHVQLTCWIKGQKGSTFIVRIPY